MPTQGMKLRSLLRWPCTWNFMKAAARPLMKVKGRVVNITKFGAFVNILPGRDGLVHISKLGKGKRINTVDEVLSLGEALQVRVDDIDPNGKVSLSPVGDDWEQMRVLPRD